MTTCMVSRPRRMRTAAVRYSAALLLLLCLGATTSAVASSVSVMLDSIDPDPSWLNEETELHAGAVFTRDGAEHQQATLGWHEEFRWQWSVTPAGTVTDSLPADAGDGSGWTVWSEQPTSTLSMLFSEPGMRSVELIVEVRMVSPDGTPATDTFTAQTTTALEVLDLEDASDLRIIGMDVGELVIRWDHSPSVNAAGYKYHIEPDDDTLYDVGYTNTVRITGLTPGQMYTIKLHTYDDSGNITQSPSI